MLNGTILTKCQESIKKKLIDAYFLIILGK